MGRQIILQPNGLFMVWSTIVDDIVEYDATVEELIKGDVDEYAERRAREVNKTCEDLKNGEKPYYQRTMSFDEAKERIEDCHGKDAESLVLLGKITEEQTVELEKYTQVTIEEGKEISKKVKTWFENAPNSDMFNDCKGLCKTSVAEYIANQEGKTLYKSKVT